MVGWKLIIILVITLLLLIEGLTGGAIIKLLLPHQAIIIGEICCKVGGFIWNPTLKVGALKIPYIDGDGALFASVFTGLLATFVFRKTIKSIKFLLLAVIISWIIFFFVYKSFGAILVWIAETHYNMEGCVEYISLPGLNIKYDWFSPAFIVFAIFAIIGLIITILKIITKR